MSNLEGLILNFLSDEEQIKLHMFCPGVLYWVGGEKDNAKVVDPNYGFLAGGDLQFLKKRAQP